MASSHKTFHLSCRNIGVLHDVELWAEGGHHITGVDIAGCDMAAGEVSLPCK